MEIDQQENASYEYQEEQSGVNQSTTSRSYECNFCKRGFTNAQALGGHMNIHRKEKAKLKQSISTPPSSLSSSPNKMVVDTPKTMSTAATKFPWVVVSPSIGESHGRSGGGREETLISEEVQQLSLFVENPSNIDQNSEIIHQVLPIEVSSDPMLGSSFQHDSSVSELDLELRLGPEPQNSTPSSLPTGRTTHFF